MKKIFRSVFNWLPIKTRLYVFGFVRLGYLMNLKKPTTFNDKINLRKLSKNNSELYAVCSDKIEVRQYVGSRIGEEYLIPAIIGGSILNDEFVKLGLERFGSIVLKANHNSGPVQFLRKGASDRDIANAIIEINRQLKTKYGTKKGEHWYGLISPRVYMEKALLDNEGKVPVDYKFFVFNYGEPESSIFVQVDVDRFGMHSRNIYDENWNLLDLKYHYPRGSSIVNRPKNLETMCSLARSLGKDFDFVRVDLYEHNGKVYFGELTFAPGSGFERFNPRKFDYLFGKLWP